MYFYECKSMQNSIPRNNMRYIIVFYTRGGLRRRWRERRGVWMKNIIESRKTRAVSIQNAHLCHCLLVAKTMISTDLPTFLHAFLLCTYCTATTIITTTTTHVYCTYLFKHIINELLLYFTFISTFFFLFRSLIILIRQ